MADKIIDKRCDLNAKNENSYFDIYGASTSNFVAPMTLHIELPKIKIKTTGGSIPGYVIFQMLEETPGMQSSYVLIA